MNPEIKKFWESQGRLRLTLIGSWELSIPLGGPLSIYRIKTVAHGNRYQYKDKWYSEEEMLRIVRLKVFL